MNGREGKVALIIGAGRDNMGQDIARRFAAVEKVLAATASA
ncbi:hypothetical protein [Pseudomonas sp.]|nr:hypothetical protein [Pseudomonas sp.]HUE94742.1 hypothetical protein [Pseudomonas sp.]